MSKRKIGFDINKYRKYRKDRGEFTSFRTEVEDYADLVDAVYDAKRAYDSWWTIKNAIVFERKGNRFLRAPGVVKDEESIAVRKALDVAEVDAFWNVVRSAQIVHRLGTYAASSTLVHQVFRREAANFLAKFGTYLLN